MEAKQAYERATFIRFVGRLQDQNSWVSITSRPEPEPDLLCTHVEDGPIAFELVSLTDPKIAEILAAGEKAKEGAFVTSDPSERIIRKKLGRTYSTDAARIELLIYTDGQIISTDDMIIPTILPLFAQIQHPFERIWFMGEDQTKCLWKNGE